MIKDNDQWDLSIEYVKFHFVIHFVINLNIFSEFFPLYFESRGLGILENSGLKGYTYRWAEPTVKDEINGVGVGVFKLQTE